MYNVLLFGLVSFFTDISSEMVYPIVPLYLTAVLGATPAIIGLIEGIAESTASLLKVFSGYLGDKTGKNKKITIWGYGISAAGKLVLSFSFTWLLVLGARILDRLGKGIRTTPRDSIIADSCEQDVKGRSFGIQRTLDALGAVIGVIIAYFLIQAVTDNYIKFFILSVIPAVIGVFFIFFIKERKNCPSKGKRILLKWSILDFRLKAFLIMTVMFALGNSSRTFLILKANDMGFDAKTAILLYLVYKVVQTVFCYPLGNLSDRIGRKHVLIFGYITFGLAYLALGLVTQHILVWVIFGVVGLFMAATEGVEKAFIADVAPPEIKGTVLGLHGTLQGITLFPASLIAGALWTAFGADVPFIFSGFTGIASALFLAVLFRSYKVKPKDFAKVGANTFP